MIIFVNVFKKLPICVKTLFFCFTLLFLMITGFAGGSLVPHHAASDVCTLPVNTIYCDVSHTVICNGSSEDMLMIDSGAGVCVCPLDYATDVPLVLPFPGAAPILSTASGQALSIACKRTFKYQLHGGMVLSITYWDCPVKHLLIAVRSLTKGSLIALLSVHRVWRMDC